VIAAYALFLQVFLTGLAGAGLAADTLTSADATAFIHCFNGSDPSLPSGAPVQPHGAIHCALCAIGPHSCALPTASTALAVAYAAPRVLVWSLEQDQRPADPSALLQRSRAPPQQA